MFDLLRTFGLFSILLAHVDPPVALWLLRDFDVPLLVLVSGAATLATSDPRYVMAKPSIIAVVVGLFMLRPGWLARYIPAEIERHIADVTWLFGFAWAGLMFLTAALNLVVVLRYPDYWLAFLATFPALSKLLLFSVHGAVSVAVARRRRANERGAAMLTV